MPIYGLIEHQLELEIQLSSRHQSRTIYQTINQRTTKEQSTKSTPMLYWINSSQIGDVPRLYRRKRKESTRKIFPKACTHTQARRRTCCHRFASCATALQFGSSKAVGLAWAWSGGVRPDTAVRARRHTDAQESLRGAPGNRPIRTVRAIVRALFRFSPIYRPVRKEFFPSLLFSTLVYIYS